MNSINPVGPGSGAHVRPTATQITSAPDRVEAEAGSAEVGSADAAHALLSDLGPQCRTWSEGPALAVTVHDVEPRTFRRVQDVRGWLAARDIDRVTLAVIPAADLHPVGTRSPMLAAWLRAGVARGDAVAQHGLQHRDGVAEFANLGPEESRRRVESGLAMLREVELDPHGFIAPAYGYTTSLRRVLSESFTWFGERALVRGTRRDLRAPALRLGTASRFTRALSPTYLRSRVAVSGPQLRHDIHPADFDLTRHVNTIEQILVAARERHVITYDDIFCLQS